MAQHPEILVVGGGVIGLTTAYFLAYEGVAVEVVDQGEFGGESSWAGAGILPPGTAVRAASPLEALRNHSADLFPSLSAELKERTDIDNGYLRSGGLVVDESEEDVSSEWRPEGIALQRLEGERLREREPALAPAIGSAWYLPELAQLRNPRHLKALVAACQALGVRLRPFCPVYGFDRQGERIAAVRTSHGLLPADRFLLASGAWTELLLELVGWRPGIRPVRGQIALLNTGQPILRHVLLHGDRYLVPRPDGRVLVGSTEEQVGFDKRTTASAIAELLALAVRLVPELARAHLERTWAGLRPGTPDGLPYLGPVPGFNNLFVGAGHFRSGIQLSPATGLLLKQALLGQPLTISLYHFRIDRHAE